MKEGEKAWCPYGSPVDPRCHGREQKGSCNFQKPSVTAGTLPACARRRRLLSPLGISAGAERPKETENGEKTIRAGDKERDRLSRETDIQGNGSGAKWRKGKKVRSGSTAVHFTFSQCRLPCPSIHFPYLTFNSLKGCFTAAIVTSFWVAFRWWNSSKLLLPPNPTLLLSLYSVAASQGRKLRLIPESFHWLKTLYMELWRRAKKKKKTPAKHQLC